MPQPVGTHLGGRPEPSEGATPGPPAPGVTELKARLEAIAGTPGVRYALVTDPDGLLLDAGGNTAAEPDVAGGLLACLAQAADQIGRDLQQGGLRAVILELGTGTLMLQVLRRGIVLAISIEESAVVPTVRSRMSAALQELEEALQ